MVSDINEAKAWYSKAFDTKPYFDEPFYVGFNIAGYELGLQENNVAPEDKGISVYSYWGVDDINKVFQHLLDLGAKEDEKPNDVGDGILVASLKDPWGNLIGLIYNPHFKLAE